MRDSASVSGLRRPPSPPPPCVIQSQTPLRIKCANSPRGVSLYLVGRKARVEPVRSIFRRQQVSSRCSAQRVPPQTPPPHPTPPPPRPPYSSTIRGAFHPDLSAGRAVPECLNRLTGPQSASPQLAKCFFFSLLLLLLLLPLLPECFGKIQ